MRVALTEFGAFWQVVPEAEGVLARHRRLSSSDSLRNTPAFWAQNSDKSRPLTLSSLVKSSLKTAGLRDSKRGAWSLNPARVSVVLGSSKGDIRHFLDSQVLGEWYPQWADWWRWPDKHAHDLAHDLRVGGRVMSPVAACATGAHALAMGADLIGDNVADVVIAGAVEPPQHPIFLAAYRQMNALSKSGQMRPFDARRDGFVANCGAGFVVLESETHARNRGATIHGFLSGWSLKCDATHMTSMSASGDSIARAVDEAVSRAGNPRIDYVNAHGTATQNDPIEARGIALSLGNDVAISSTKGLTGHLLGAAGSVESVICLLAMKQNFAPPTWGLEQLDEELSGDFVMGNGREMEMNASLSLNYGFGGHIGALVFEKT